MLIYKWTDGNDIDFQKFYMKTEEYSAILLVDKRGLYD